MGLAQFYCLELGVGEGGNDRVRESRPVSREKQKQSLTGELSKERLYPAGGSKQESLGPILF